MPRWGRDILILTVIVGSVVGFNYLRQYFAEPRDNSNTSAFSNERQTADRAARDQDWFTATENFKVLTERDPYNSYAWYSLGDCKWMQSNPIRAELKQERMAAEPNMVRIAELQLQLREIGLAAIANFKKAMESGRYRLMAGQYVAAIHVALGENDEALEMLEKCLDDGLSWRGIYNAPQLSELRADPRFLQLAERNRQSFLRGPNPFINPGRRK